LAGLLFFAPSLRAQDVVAENAVSNETDSSTIVYDQEFFAQYNVTTAEDILRRIPGVAAMLDDAGGGGNNDRRGFGSGGDQILINGRRLAGKSNEISSALRRIQIQNLDRVELLRGTSNDIDVRSDGVVINLILKEGEAATRSGSVMLAGQLDDHGWNDLDGTINYNGELGKLGYIVSLEKSSVGGGGGGGGGDYSRRYRDESYFYPTGELMQARLSESRREVEEYSFAANSTYHSERGDALQLNALIKPSSQQVLDEIQFTEFAIDGTPGLSGTDLRSEIVDQDLEWEMGGTYERRVGESGNFKILTVYNHEDKSSENERNILVGNVLSEVNRNLSDVLETEAILRSSYYWPLSSSQTLEIGAETASNSLEQTIEVYSDLNGDGIVEKVDIFNPSSKVEETRSELFVNHNWTLTERWTASSSLVAESSTLSQSGEDINNETHFDFIKPRIDIRFASSPADQLRMKIERTVSQLNFSDFVPEYNIRDDRFTEGNPDLRPETAWEYEIGYEHRLGDDQGVVAARIFYKDVQDHIENVAIDPDGDGEFDSATGNIGDATQHGFALTFSVRMASLGVPDLIIDGGYEWRESRVTDPFTGLERKMSGSFDTTTNLSLRHDVSAWQLSYGASVENSSGENIRSEWSEYRSFVRDPDVVLFIEKRFGARWTLRFDALDVTQSKRERTRLIYADNAAVGTLRRTEFFEDTRDRRYMVSLTSTF
jgi:outer membrane receptor protein involved in Fe transport